MIRPALCGLLLLGLAACDEGRSEPPPAMVYFADDLVERSSFARSFFDAYGPGADVLHEPYIAGARFTLQLQSNDPIGAWRLESSDPEVLAVTGRAAAKNEYGPTFEVEPRATGLAELRAYDTGGVLRRTRSVQVYRPDRVELYPIGPDLVGRTPVAVARRARLVDDDPPPRGVKLLEGGTATFLLRYFSGAVELHGRHVLEVKGRTSGAISPRLVQVFEDREWLQVTADGLHGGAIELGLRDEKLRAIEFEVVGLEDVDHIQVVGESEAYAQHGDTLSLLTEVRAADGSPIYGAELSFAAYKGDPVKACPSGVCRPAGLGDMYLYTYSPAQEVELEAALGDHTTKITIHSSGGAPSTAQPYGTSSWTCAFAPAAPRGLAWAFALAAVALVARRRAYRGAAK